MITNTIPNVSDNNHYDKIYLIFASVYVCEEVFKQILLSAMGDVPGSEDSHEHHHHPRIDDFDRDDCANIFFWIDDNGNSSHLPLSVSPIQLLLKLSSSAPPWTRGPTELGDLSTIIEPSQYHSFDILNVYLGVFRILTAVRVPVLAMTPRHRLHIANSLEFRAQHNMADIAVVCAEAVLTFLISYPGAVALRSFGSCENLRTTYIPAPNLCQLSPLPPRQSHHPQYHDDEGMMSGEGTLATTGRLPVKREMDDADALEPANVAREQRTHALGVSGASVMIIAVRR
ncbi:hypothetical protein FRB95_008117 [Tulasnella sp. JGI-2019a]|nr:hypothetical protein FRB95_008117 [Tulasnella sp. JGI-2019a]